VPLAKNGLKAGTAVICAGRQDCSFRSDSREVDEREAAASLQPTIRSFVVLMLVKKPSNLLLQFELTGRVTHRSGVIKELPLDFSRKIIPLHDHGCAEKPQHTLFDRMEYQIWSEIRFWRR
jgi:hypothetical protein